MDKKYFTAEELSILFDNNTLYSGTMDLFVLSVFFYKKGGIDFCEIEIRVTMGISLSSFGIRLNFFRTI